MTKYLSFLFVAFIFLTSPVMAQEAGENDVVTDVEAVGEEKAPIKDIAPANDYEARLKLARDMHEIWPIRIKVESAIDRIGEQIEEAKRLRFKSAMRQAIKFEALEQASIESMADIFTAKELSAMIAFYGSKEGRSVSHKTGDYERALEPLLIKMIDKAILDTKLGSE